MGETQRGFHALEKKIHDIEEEDRKAERQTQAPQGTAPIAKEERAERRPPPAHDA
jgi:hypothetical protein